MSYQKIHFKLKILFFLLITTFGIHKAYSQIYVLCTTSEPKECGMKISSISDVNTFVANFFENPKHICSAQNTSTCAMTVEGPFPGVRLEDSLLSFFNDSYSFEQLCERETTNPVCFSFQKEILKKCMEKGSAECFIDGRLPFESEEFDTELLEVCTKDPSIDPKCDEVLLEPSNAQLLFVSCLSNPKYPACKKLPNVFRQVFEKENYEIPFDMEENAAMYREAITRVQNCVTDRPLPAQKYIKLPCHKMIPPELFIAMILERGERSNPYEQGSHEHLTFEEALKARDEEEKPTK